jgi:hypothetical protein
MVEFVRRHAASVTGVISGFDRSRFRRTWRLGSSVRGLGRFMSYVGVWSTEGLVCVLTATGPK